MDDYDDDYDCELCWPTDGSEPSMDPHCCGCGADGGPGREECVCEEYE